MLNQIYQEMLYFLDLSLNPEVLWNILPLAIATIFIIIYFQMYKDEKPGWESHFSNSLVLLFVSMSLFRYIYNLGIPGIDNLINYYEKSSATVLLLIIGTSLAKINFEHLMPEKLAGYTASPLTVNLVAYAVILFVFMLLFGFITGKTDGNVLNKKLPRAC